MFLADDDTTVRPVVERDIRLEDFFWTGESGDGPPYYLRRTNVVGDGGFNFVRTSTLYATVYINGDAERIDDDDAAACSPDCDYRIIDDYLVPNEPCTPMPPTSPPATTLSAQRYGHTVGTTAMQMPDDQRFWLLSILSGHYDAALGLAALQERLASLYRLAFSR